MFSFILLICLFLLLFQILCTYFLKLLLFIKLGRLVFLMILRHSRLTFSIQLIFPHFGSPTFPVFQKKLFNKYNIPYFADVYIFTLLVCHLNHVYITFICYSNCIPIKQMRFQNLKYYERCWLKNHIIFTLKCQSIKD